MYNTQGESVLRSLAFLKMLKKKWYANFFHQQQELLSIYRRTESCHSLPSKGINKIIHFSQRKDAGSVLRNWKKLKKFDPFIIDIQSIKVYINESLCQYCKCLWSKHRQLWSKEKVRSLQISNGQLKQELSQNGKYHLCSIFILWFRKFVPEYSLQLSKICLFLFLLYKLCNGSGCFLWFICHVFADIDWTL